MQRGHGATCGQTSSHPEALATQGSAGGPPCPFTCCIGLVNGLDFPVVARGQNLDEDALIRASALEDKGRAREVWVAAPSI